MTAPPASRRAPAITPWDVRVARRAAMFSALTLVLALLVTALTDEGSVGLTVRVGRALPAAPVCGAVGTWLALRGARLRGEVRALETLGRSPLENALAAALGGAVMVVLAAGALAAFDAVAIAGFYPHAAPTSDYRLEGDAFVNARGGFRVTAEGDIDMLPATGRPDTAGAAAPSAVPARGRGAAALALALAGAGLALITARPRRGRSARDAAADGVALAITVVLAIVLFHAAAVGRVPALVAALPSALLLGWALFRYRARPWTKRMRS